MKGSTSVDVAADPDRIWRMIADVTQMGSWSPECVGCDWLDGASGPEPGARFRGHNRLGPFRWSTTCTVEASDPGSEFTFVARHWSGATTRWRYTLEPAGATTHVTESYQALHTPGWMLALELAVRRGRTLDRSVRSTLEQLRAAAERA
jgi:hypothetical protein